MRWVVLSTVEVVGWTEIQQHRRSFVVMSVSSLWAQTYILGLSNNKGIVREDAETGPSARWPLLIVWMQG